MSRSNTPPGRNQKSKEKPEKVPSKQTLEVASSSSHQVAQQPGTRRKEETVRRHSAHVRSNSAQGLKSSASTTSASSFLFDAQAKGQGSERLSAATEAAVQDIASEILGEDTAPKPGLQVASCPVDPWASSDSESSEKGESEQPALQDARAASMSSTAQSSVPSAEPEVELEPPGSKSVLKAARLHRALLKVQTNASQGKFAEAIQDCLPALLGPQEVVDIVGSLCAAWQASIKKQKREHQDAMEALVSEVTTAREKDSPEVWRLLEEIDEKETEVTEQMQRRAELQELLATMEEELSSTRKDLKASQQRADQWRRLKDEKERELFAQIRKREDAEREASFLRQSAWLADRTARENVALKKQLQKAEATAASRAAGALPKQIAEMECSPLRCCRGDARPTIKKKLMMKWHPDKQPTAEHVEFATQVMQAMQNQPEWE